MTSAAARAVAARLRPALQATTTANLVLVRKAKHPGHIYLGQISDYYGPEVATTLAASTSGLRRAVVAAVARNLTPAELSSAEGRTVLRSVVADEVTITPKALRQILTSIIRDGYLAGTHVASEAVGAAQVTSSAGKLAAGLDWGTWAPGHPAAADLVDDGGLADLLDAADVTIAGIADTTLDRIGASLAQSLRTGASVDETAAALSGIVSDPDRAEMIANTETNRAMSQASLDTYVDAGVATKVWLVFEPCDVCADNEGAGAIALDEDFPSGDAAPPAHPRCRCSVAPGPGTSGADVEEG